jgi:hypothetical protein
MNKQFEHMQKLAFGKKSINESTTKSAFKRQIKEMILAEMNEAKKKKSEDVAPQEDVELNIGNEGAAPPVDMPTDTMTPDAPEGMDIDPKVKSIQDSLQKAYANAKALGDEKLATQIGNTLTMLLRDQVLGQQNVNENEDFNPFMDWKDDQIYDSLINIDQEQLVSQMMNAVEENPSITLFEFCKKFED